jgi:electron transfer flavoprotein alpha subunit
MPHTYQVRFVPAAHRDGPHRHQRLHRYKKDGDKLLFTRQMFQGKLAADVSFACDARGLSPQNGAFRGDKVDRRFRASRNRHRRIATE